MPRLLPPDRLARRLVALTAALCLILSVLPHVARAGTYTVTGGCSWDPFDTGGSGTTVFAICPQLFARNVGGNFSTPVGGNAGWAFHAPAGTWINNFALQG